MKICSPFFLIGLALTMSFHSAVANTFTVTTTSDTGPGSLRQAITNSNGLSGADTIDFNIPASDPNCDPATHVCTITAESALPIISDSVAIDGYTQPGSSANTLALGNNAVLLIELKGTSAAGSGLVVTGAGSIIRGLVINRFAAAGIYIRSGNNLVAGNFIGVDATGNFRLGNNPGVRIETGANNLVGGTVPAARNVISGNGTNVTIEEIISPNAPGPTGTLIRGNYIGTNAAGTAAINPQAFGNSPGVSVEIGTGTIIGGSDSDDGTTDGNVGARNVISGNSNGIVTSGDFGFAVELSVQGNFVGVDVTGAAALGNFGNGVHFDIQRSDSSITVGGTTAGSGNVISGNTGAGILADAQNVRVLGNQIGTDVTGTIALANTGSGIALSGSSNSSGVIIGGSAPGAGNVISGNGSYGIFSSNRAAGPTVQGNLIGTQSDGFSPLGNRFNGIFVSATALIGGTTSGAGNVIAFNSTGTPQFGSPQAGIVVFDQQGGFPAGVRILGNSIFSNLGIGIELGGTGAVTPNDIGDADAGPNNLQNFPVLASATPSNGGVTVVGTLNSRPNTTYRIEFFGNAQLDPTGFGEGQTYLGFVNVTTDADGNASFSAPVAAGEKITATATDPSGNTSEFSGAIGHLLNISTRLRVQTGDKVLIGGFIISGTDPKKVIVRGIGPSLAGSVQGFLADPTLELHDATSTLATNDDWKTRPDGSSQQAEIEETTIPPTHNLESALVRTLPADNAAYTAILRGKNNTTGTGVLELYDLDATVDSKLANISTRGLVETGNNVLIGGFIPGSGVTKVIIRAIGPTLVNAGIPDALQDPTLQLVNASGTALATNDDWKTRPDGSSQQAEIEATTIPPSDNRESALVASLPPGNYTAVVRGKNNTIGIAVVEVYNIQ